MITGLGVGIPHQLAQGNPGYYGRALATLRPAWWSGQMRPFNATNNHRYGRSRNVESVGKCYACHTLTMKDADLAYILIRKFGARISRPWHLTTTLSTLLHLVCHVISARAEKEMRRIDAGRGIAMVADAQANGDRAVMKFVTETMSQDFTATVANLPILQTVGRASPGPAIIRPASVNVHPKTPSCKPAILRGVPPNILDWLTHDPTLASVATRSDRRGLTTAAHAKAGWVNRLGGSILLHVDSLLGAIDQTAGHSSGAAVTYYSTGGLW